MLDTLFHPLIAEWFHHRFGEPTEAQRLGWPEISAGRHTLIAAPTGSGKTLAAFLSCLDRLWRDSLAGPLPDAIQVVYISPLKALSNDIHRNLEIPLAEIRAAAEEAGLPPPPIRAAVRTGDTPTSQRAAMLRRPPHILVTTPESLYLLLTSPKSRELLRGVKTVIVDEIHALARDKRGSHLTLSLERLAAICERPPVRIGLSATQRPMDQIARFLVGGPRPGSDTEPPCSIAAEPACSIIDVGHIRTLDLALEVPQEELSAVCSHEMWAEIYGRLCQLIAEHRSTLIFVNTRRMAERVAYQLTELLGQDAVASHHGSLSREIRLSAEERLKAGQLKAIVATASLEMGIDVGFIDLVCQIGSPRSIATFLQRIGRSGHSLGVTPKGRLFPLTRDELLECISLLVAVRRGRLDQIEIPQAPLDILAQQIVAAVACEEWSADDLFDLCRRAWPFRDLSRAHFDEILTMLSEGVGSPNGHQHRGGRGAYLHRDLINGQLRARRGARIAAITSGGAIPEMADFRVVTMEDDTYVGTLNEDFAIESQAGDIFLLGNTSWQIRFVRGGEVIVSDAHGAPATVPFWLGEAPGRTVELSAELSELRAEIARRITLNGESEVESRKSEIGSQHDPLSECSDFRTPTSDLNRLTTHDSPLTAPQLETDLSAAVRWLVDECGASEWAAEQAAHYIAAQQAAVGMIPTRDEILFERFFDESGGMQLVIHAPLGARINRAWGLALRKRFCRSFDFELQAAADDNGVVLSLSPQHSFPVDMMFKMISPDNGEYLLSQALLAAPLFQTRWRWNVTRALAVLRQRHGKKVPPHLQRFHADDLLAAVFPAQTGCFENHHGDTKIPDHPLVRQTVHDCLHEAMDINRWLEMLKQVQQGAIRFVARDTREPSPFSHALLNSQPYTFLDDAPLEERRARAVATRRSLSIEAVRDLGRLDPEAIALVKAEAWPLVRDADELHDALLSMVALRDEEAVDWYGWFYQLVAAGRATIVRRPTGPLLWVAAERWPAIKAIYPNATADPPLVLPDAVKQDWESAAALVAMIRGRLQSIGPTKASQLAAEFQLDSALVFAALESIESEGIALRGRFTTQTDDSEIEWCDRRLLARIHRYTLDGLRRQIQPVEPVDYIRFLVAHHRLTPDLQRRGRVGVREALAQLEGLQIPAGAWETRVLPGRVATYDSAWLDELSLSGELMWGRLRPPSKAKDDLPTGAPITRAVPISLVLREDLSWLLSPERKSVEGFARGNALLVLDALKARGALFQHELRAVTGLLPTQMDEALHELASLGLVTSDTFGAVRALVARKRVGRDQGWRRRSSRTAGSSAGRWSMFPGLVPEVTDEERLTQWAWLLLRRWGVVFREVVGQETSAPAWQRLVGVYRRLEARGEIRGGRFVGNVGGEQYALPDAVERLRRMRDEAPQGQWVVISAADPLNLSGVLTPDLRIPSRHTATLVLQDGRVVASQQSGVVEFHETVPPVLAAEMSRRLRRWGNYSLQESSGTAVPRS